MEVPYAITVYSIFLDFEQAFDTVNSRAVDESWKGGEVQLKLIRLLKIALKYAVTEVKVSDNDFSECSEVSAGVREGDA